MPSLRQALFCCTLNKIQKVNSKHVIYELLTKNHFALSLDVSHKDTGLVLNLGYLLFTNDKSSRILYL